MGAGSRGDCRWAGRRPDPMARPDMRDLTTQIPRPYVCPVAQVAELVDALVSGTSAARRGGSSPLLGTTSKSPTFPAAYESPEPLIWDSNFISLLEITRKKSL